MLVRDARELTIALALIAVAGVARRDVFFGYPIIEYYFSRINLRRCPFGKLFNWFLAGEVRSQPIDLLVG